MAHQPESWTHRKLSPDWQWDHLSTNLAATQVDLLNWLAWTKTEAAAKGGQPPKLLPRPGDPAPAEEEKPLLVTIEELEEHLNRPRE